MDWMLMRWLVLSLAIAPFFYYALCVFAAWHFFREAKKHNWRQSNFTPPISILKPVRGLDPEAYENFASFCRQDYPEYEILFNVGDEDDPVVPVIQKLIEDFPQRQIRLLVGSDPLGHNDKVCKLARMAHEARYDLLVESDSDIRVPPDYLREVAAPFRDPRVGAVTTLFRGIAGKNLGARLECITAFSEFCAGALAARVLEGVKFAHGATMATWKVRLAEIGGFEALADLHSDDFAFGNRIAANGFRVEILPRPVWMLFPSQRVRDYFLHERRWTIGLRNIRPWAHAGLLFSQGALWAVLVALAAPSPALTLGYVGAYLVVRIGMVWYVGVRGLEDPVVRANLWLVPIRDVIGVAIWFASFLSNRITWRGRDFVIQQGRLVPVPHAANAKFAQGALDASAKRSS
jgi:ceramide glucosyltransferase